MKSCKYLMFLFVLGCDSSKFVNGVSNFTYTTFKEFVFKEQGISKSDLDNNLKALVDLETKINNKLNTVGKDNEDLSLNKIKQLYKNNKFTQIINLVNNNPKLLRFSFVNFYLAQAYYETNNFELALKYYNFHVNAGSLIMPLPYTLYRIGVCNERIGKVEDAKKVFKHLIDRYSDTNWAKMSRIKLKKL